MGVAVVTGAGQGIGKATAQRLARDGHHVVAVDRNGENAAVTAKEVGGESRVCDVTDRHAVLEMAKTIDGCDILINNAGIWRFHSLLDMTEDDAQSVLAVNVLGIVWCLQAFVPKMIERGGGSIVSLSSGAAWTQSPGIGIYPATKTAVESLTKTMAIELGRHNIRANAVGPGLIVSDGTSVNYQGDRAKERAKGVPMQRVGDPTEIADVIGFLCSHDARYVNGQVIYIDGGVTAGRESL
jgi:3-oxoacyl-[acyl-carrier protein] reductase